MYLVDGKMYQKLPVNIDTGEMQWIRYPEELFPNLEQMMNVEETAAVVPPALEDYLYYQLLGTTEINEEEVYEIVVYGRVDDLNKFMEAAAGQLGNDPQMQELLGQVLAMIDSMSFWSIQYIGAQDYLTKSAEMFFIVNFTDEFAGMPNPLEGMQMKMIVEEYSYDEDFTIELPDEALDATLMELPELPADSEQPE